MPDVEGLEPRKHLIKINQFFIKLKEVSQDPTADLSEKAEIWNNDGIIFNREFIANDPNNRSTEVFQKDTQTIGYIKGILQLSCYPLIHKLIQVGTLKRNVGQEILDAIEETFYQILLGYWQGENRSKLLHSPSTYPILIARGIRSETFCNGVWRSFFNVLETFDNLDQYLEMISTIAIHLYDLKKCTIRFADPANIGDLKEVITEISEDLTNRKFPLKTSINTIDSRSRDLPKIEDIKRSENRIVISLDGIEMILGSRTKSFCEKAYDSLASSFLESKQLFVFGFQLYNRYASNQAKIDKLNREVSAKISESLELSEQVHNFSKTLWKSNRKIAAIVSNIPVGLITFDSSLKIDPQNSSQLENFFDRESIESGTIYSLFLDYLNLPVRRNP